MAKTRSEAYSEALHALALGRLKHLDVSRSFDNDSWQVRMVIYVDANDELDVYQRLAKVLTMCMNGEE